MVARRDCRGLRASEGRVSDRRLSVARRVRIVWTSYGSRWRRQLEAVDAALPPWEAPPGSETGCVGRVETIRNLVVDREHLRAIQRSGACACHVRCGDVPEADDD